MPSSVSRLPEDDPSSKNHSTTDKSTTQPQPPGTKPLAPKISSPYSHSRLGTLWSGRMPDYSGSYAVGVLDVEFPIPRQRIGSFRHKKLKSNGEAGVEIGTVLFTLFYPCEVAKTANKGVLWFPRFGPTIDGFMHMAGTKNPIYKGLAYVAAFPAVHGLKFPAYQRAPPLPPQGEKWPLVLFSHGVGSSRLMYTHLCGELASRGYVVAAVEHRDGTGPSARVTSEDGKSRDVDFLRWTDLEWPQLPPDEQPKDDTTLRHDQLAIRLVEMRATLDVMNKICRGDLGDSRSSLQASRTVNWTQWRDVVECGDGTVSDAGPSYGGTAAIAAAADPRFHPVSVITMDPAIQRIEPWSSPIPCPLLSINSEWFTHGADYPRLLSLTKTVLGEKHIMGIAGTNHPSFSDVFLITPSFVGGHTGLEMEAYEVFLKTLEAVDVFLDDRVGAEEREARLKALGKEIEEVVTPLGKPGQVFYQILA